MNDQEFADILSLGHEKTGVEFKGPGPLSDSHLFAKVTEAVLGMANRRDGGLVVIGVEDNAGMLNPVGVGSIDLATWKYDDISSKFAEYADPSISFDFKIHEYQGSSYVVIHVHEFDTIPILCKKPYLNVLRQGACYVRSRRKPETTEIPTQEDMRDLIELATEKSLRRFVEQAHRAGISFVSLPVLTDQGLFDRQLGI